jgi:UDP-N-acetylmuramate dehydrogenase
MVIKNDVSLRDVNTFGIDVNARYYVELTHLSQLKSIQPLFNDTAQPFLLLGGGSNILLTGDFKGVVARVMFRGVKVVEQTIDHVLVKAMAGENWERFVEYCVHQGWGGLENLTLIPGNVGTSPIQNIGAYGSELKDVFHSLEAFEPATGTTHTFFPSDCHFGYRDSFFKREGRNRFIILSVCFRLTTHQHNIKLHYGPVKTELEKMQVDEPGIDDVMKAIQNIRRSKLPDPQVLGNAGSFFKNPVLPVSQFETMASKWPGMPSYADESGNIKTAAAWLIEKAGWKGFRRGDAGVHNQQALVLVNYGHATGKEIYQLAREIQHSVLEMFGVELEMEVNVV